jgi:hypothetical protein
VERDRKDPAEDSLPVTAELGDEGGSYGDATLQAETFKGARGNTRVDPKTVAAPARDAERLEPDADSRGPAEDAVKYPTEE